MLVNLMEKNYMKGSADARAAEVRNTHVALASCSVAL